MARRTVNPAPSFTKASSGILIDSTMGILTFEEMLTLQAAAELPTLPDLTRKKRRAARAVTMVRGLSASGRRPGRKAGAVVEKPGGPDASSGRGGAPPATQCGNGGAPLELDASGLRSSGCGARL